MSPVTRSASPEQIVATTTTTMCHIWSRASPTNSGHDLRLDEQLQSKRRQLLPPSEAPPTAPGSSTEGGMSGSGLGVDMDWREEIRLASQLPDDDSAGIGNPL